MNDSKQREQALNIKQSYIIQAPAGSGKTELLTQRYLKLLSISRNPENIIALTFTNKAVAELKSRIIAALQLTSVPAQKHKKLTYDLAQAVIEQNKKNNWNILKNINRINVLTIDSLAYKINNSYPQDYDFSHKNTLENFAALELYQSAAKNILLQIENELSVQQLLIYFENNSNSFIDLVAKMLSFRDKWVNKIFDAKLVNLELITQCIKNINQDYLTDIQKLAKNNLNQEFFDLILSNPNFNQFTQLPNNIEKWNQLKELIFTKKNILRKDIGGFTKNNKIKFIQIINNFPSEFINFWTNIDYLPDEKINDKLLTNIAKVLMLANTELQRLFSQDNTTDFMQIMLTAKDILDDKNKISDISLVLDYKLEHILIDEFQDTSYLQLELIKNIVTHWEIESKKTLFLVGDPMQSIYLFRGAQVGVFLKTKKDGIKGIKLKNLILSKNFRSAKNLVEANNKIFNKIFPTKNDINNGAISYTPSIGNNLKIDNALNIHAFGYNQDEKEAQKVIKIINNNKGKEIAILCLSRKHTAIIIKHLNQEKINFEAIKNTKLSKNIFIKDLLSFTKVLLNPNDKLAWLSVLRMPWCGLKLDDILQLSTGQIYQQLQNNTTLSADGCHRANQIYITFKNAFDNFGSFSLVNILISIIKNLKIDQTMSSFEEIIFNRFIQIIEQCEIINQCEISVIQSYLNDLYVPSNNNLVKIMTIHQAKGLEFEIVIIPAIGKKSKALKGPLIHLSEFKNHSLLLAPKPNKKIDKIYNYLHYIETTRNKFEKIRLLYVAMTRAKEQIHLLGATNKKNNAEKNSFLSLLWNQYSYLWKNTIKNEDLAVKNITYWHRYKNINLAKLATVHRVAIRQNVDSSKLTSSIIGKVIHKFLQLEIFNPSKIMVINQLLSFGINQLELENSQKIVQQMLENTKNSADFDFIFKIRSTTLVEAEFFDNNKTIIIDRLFIKDNTLWIIDFKTSNYQSKKNTEEQFITKQLMEHTKQIKNYKKILKKIYSKPTKTAIFLTSIGRMIILT